MTKVYGIEFESYIDYGMFDGDWTSRVGRTIFSTRQQAIDHLIDEGYKPSTKENKYEKCCDEKATIIEFEFL